MPFQCDEDALKRELNAFYCENARRLRKYVGRHVPTGEQVADDLCQQAWLAFFPKWERFRCYDEPLAVLLKIAKRLIANWYDRRGTSPVLPGDEEVDQLADALFSKRSRRSDEYVRIDLASALNRLTERQREAINLRFRDDLDMRTVAAELGITVDGAKKVLRTALRKLRESGLLAGYEWNEQGEEGQK